MTTDLRHQIARAIHRYDHEHGLSGNDIPSEHHQGEADAVLAVLQGAYVPPPPGSDRDKLPDWVLDRVSLPPYLSTGCQTAQGLEESARRESPDAELVVWARRMHASCRQTRKQDMAPCTCPHHLERAVDVHLDEVGQ